jgi:hypothetical protein
MDPGGQSVGQAAQFCLGRFAVVYRALIGETRSATAIRLRARSPEPAVIFDIQFHLVRGASNYAAAYST